MSVEIVALTVSTASLRIARGLEQFLVSCTSLDTVGNPIRIRRWRFAHTDIEAVGTRVLDEILAAAAAEAQALRLGAEQATRRAVQAGTRMRPACGALRDLEAASATAMNHYLNRGQAIAQACAEAQARLATSGFPTPERDLPPWVAEIQRIITSDDAPSVVAEA
jgi:hypothetical protein